MIKVLPSSNPVEEKNLVDYVKQLESLGVEYLHCDVMDGKFVENKCFSVELLEQVRNNTNILLDVHLMVENTKKAVKEYIKFKPNIITIHLESVKSSAKIRKIAKMVKSKGVMFGLSIKPKTPVCEFVEFLDILDLILIMSVEPGKSGQTFIPNSLQKIKDAKVLCENKNIIIEVDGGINLDNFKDVVDSGAEYLVMGSAFYNAENKKKLLSILDDHYND